MPTLTHGGAQHAAGHRNCRAFSLKAQSPHSLPDKGTWDTKCVTKSVAKASVPPVRL